MSAAFSCLSHPSDTLSARLQAAIDEAIGD